MLAEGDQQTIDLDPVAARQHPFEFDHGLLRGCRVDVAPAVGDAENVDVHGDARLVAGNAKHQIGTLRADAPEREQYPIIARQSAIELVDDATGDRENLLRLGVVKGRRVDQLVDVCRR